VRVNELDGYEFVPDAAEVDTGENGIALFEDLVIRTVGCYSLVFSAENAGENIVSNPFKVKCMNLQDFEIPVSKIGEPIQVRFDDEFRELEYVFQETDHNEDVVEAIINDDGELEITPRIPLSEPYSFNYTATAEGQPDGCGVITLIPAEEERSGSIEIITQPSDTTAGSSITGPPAVRLTDAEGNPIVEIEVQVKERGGSEFDAGDTAESLLACEPRHIADGFTRDGRSVVFQRWNPHTKGDLWILPLDGRRTPRP
jgi:hypothetical protein